MGQTLAQKILDDCFPLWPEQPVFFFIMAAPMCTTVQYLCDPDNPNTIFFPHAHTQTSTFNIGFLAPTSQYHGIDLEGRIFKDATLDFHTKGNHPTMYLMTCDDADYIMLVHPFEEFMIVVSNKNIADKIPMLADYAMRNPISLMGDREAFCEEYFRNTERAISLYTQHAAHHS